MPNLSSTQKWDSSNLHVVTENGEQCFIWRSKQLTYIAQDRQELPQVLAHKFGALATKLDLSYNTLTSFRNINLFTNLSELVLDNNLLDDDQLDFKENLRLKTLSLNKNKLTNLYRLITSIKIYFPNLEYLSLIGNPLCPSPIYRGGFGESVGIRRLSAPSLGGARKTVTINAKAATTMTTAKATPAPTSANDLCSSSSHFAAQIIDDQQADFVYQKYRYFIIYHLPNLRFLDSSPISGRERDEALKRCYWMKSFSSGNVDYDYDDGNSNSTSTSSSNNNNNSGNNLKEKPQDGQAALGNNKDDHSNSNTNGLRQRAEPDFKLAIMSDYVDACHPQSQPRPSSSSSTLVRTRASMPATAAMATGGITATASSTCEGSQQSRGAFSRLSYLYTGRNSEGNRFIRNQDL